MKTIYKRFQDEPPADDRDAWGREQRVEELLGSSFELAFEEREWRLEGESTEALWELSVRATPPMKAFVDALEPVRRAEFRAAFIEHWNGFVSPDGRVSEPRRYLLVLGTRR